MSKSKTDETGQQVICENISKPIVLYLGPGDSTRIGDGAELIQDDSAFGGTCIKMPLNGHSWAVQWFFDSALLNDVDYLIRIKVRADKKSQKGSAFGCGVYSVAKKTTPLKLIVDSSEIADDGYGWVDCGNVNGSDAESAYFYLAQLSPSAVEYVYISAIEFIPEGEDGYRTDVREKPMVLSTTPAQVEVGDVVYLKPGATRQLLFPAEKISDDGCEVISVSPTTNYWSTKWHIFNHLAPGEYKVRALLKLRGARDGRGIRFGIYSPEKGREVFKKIIPVTQIPDLDKYQWLDLGRATVIDDNKSYLFVCSLGDNSFDTFLLKTIELTRIK